MFQTLMGPDIYTRILFIIAVSFCFIEIMATLFTIIYQRFVYHRVIKPKYDSNYEPRCSIIVPCKGLPKDLGSNLRGFLELDYKDYEVIFVVESETDPAVSEIKEVCSDRRVSLVVAGFSKECAQKNHNMLAAIRKATDTEVFVFADSDIKPSPEWLKELTMPLSDSKVTVTSGFRWLHALKATPGELTHFYVNTFIYITFTTACFFGGVGLWGGSMAIRKEDFDGLGVAKKWSRAAVDDMSLSDLVFKSSKKAVIVPTCLTKSDDLIQSVGSTISWFERQIMYLKAYQKPLWLIALPLSLIGSALLFLLPFSLLGSFFSNHKSFTALGGGAAVIFYAGQALTALLYPLMGKTPPKLKFLLFQPFLRFTHALSYFRTIITNTIIWAGIEYKVSSNGDVESLQRLVGELK
ncbi:glycosyl transferase, group 2 [Chitinispirillum alkaliphilum]|nr:glycosyl transferase, group 2 [Chitinispirillum alkaliphilum]